jgi:hypothetical protein
MATIVSTTIKEADGDYSSVGAWESGQQGNLVAADEIRKGVISGVWTSAESEVTFNGWTCDATRYAWVTQGYLTQTALDTTKHYFNVDGNPTLNGLVHVTGYAQLQKFVFEGLQARIQNCTTGSKGVFATAGTGVVDVILSGCIGIVDGGTSDAIYTGLWLYGSVRVINSICYHINAGAFWARGWGWVDAAEYNPTIENCLYHCTSYGYQDSSPEGAGYYVHDADDLVIAKNCVSTGHAGDAYYEGGADRWHTDSRNCLADDANVPDQGSGHLASKTITYVNAGARDLRLAATDTDAMEAGADLSADTEFANMPATVGVHVDFFGNDRTWTSTPDVGAHQYTTAAGAGPTSPADAVDITVVA